VADKGGVTPAAVVKQAHIRPHGGATGFDMAGWRRLLTLQHEQGHLMPQLLLCSALI
jgi:hypothetical protein